MPDALEMQHAQLQSAPPASKFRPPATVGDRDAMRPQIGVQLNITGAIKILVWFGTVLLIDSHNVPFSRLPVRCHHLVSSAPDLYHVVN